MAGGGALFRDRRDAGRKLAAALMPFKAQHPIVLALPRGGVPVGFEVAQALDAPLDVLLVRKIGAPDYPELGLGALVEGNPPQTVLNEDVMAAVSPSGAYLESEHLRQLTELERRQKLYRGTRSLPSLKGRTIILVDDGIATGGTARAALRGLEALGAGRVVLAVPVAPADVLASLRPLAAQIVCLETPAPFSAVGEHYALFPQTTDEEVVSLLAGGGGSPA